MLFTEVIEAIKPNSTVFENWDYPNGTMYEQYIIEGVDDIRNNTLTLNLIHIALEGHKAKLHYSSENLTADTFSNIGTKIIRYCDTSKEEYEKKRNKNQNTQNITNDNVYRDNETEVDVLSDDGTEVDVLSDDCHSNDNHLDISGIHIK